MEPRLSETSDAATDVWSVGGYEVTRMRGATDAWLQWEDALEGAALPLPLPHRSSWAAIQPSSTTTWFFAVADVAGAPAGAFAAQLTPTRALPGHVLLRCERFGPGVVPAARHAAMSALLSAARAHRRVLRIHVETFATDDAERTALEQLMADLGFGQVPVDDARIYEHSLLLTLAADEEAIFEGFSRSARRNIRQAAKAPVELRPIEDPALFPRLDAISRETYARTGGTYYPADWPGIVALSRRDVTGSRLVGLFRTDMDGPDGLLAYAWGNGHGDHAHYSRSGSTRATNVKVALMYVLLWDLIRWARRIGVRRFDFGGITGGTLESEDQLGGISDFKRHFSQDQVRVGAEWVLEPRRGRASAARAISFTSRRAGRFVAVVTSALHDFVTAFIEFI